MDKLQQLKHLVDQLIVQGNLDSIDVAFSEVYLAHAGEKTHKGLKFIKQYTKQIRTAIPDIKVLKIELLSQTENLIAWQRTYSGTHKAKLKGMLASNKKIRWYEIVVSRFENNQITEEWICSDLAFQLINIPVICTQ